MLIVELWTSHFHTKQSVLAQVYIPDRWQVMKNNLEMSVRLLGRPLNEVQPCFHCQFYKCFWTKMVPWSNRSTIKFQVFDQLDYNLSISMASSSACTNPWMNGKNQYTSKTHLQQRLTRFVNSTVEIVGCWISKVPVLFLMTTSCPMTLLHSMTWYPPCLSYSTEAFSKSGNK